MTAYRLPSGAVPVHYPSGETCDGMDVMFDRSAYVARCMEHGLRVTTRPDGGAHVGPADPFADAIGLEVETLHRYAARHAR